MKWHELIELFFAVLPSDIGNEAAKICISIHIVGFADLNKAAGC